MKNKTFLDSIKCAFNGLVYGLKTEKNFKYYTFISFTFFVINLVCKTPIWGHIMFFVVCCGVFSTEFINTSIEHLANAISLDIRKDIKIIKDMAATSVLIWGFAFFIMEFILIGYGVYSLWI